MVHNVIFPQSLQCTERWPVQIVYSFVGPLNPWHWIGVFHPLLFSNKSKMVLHQFTSSKLYSSENVLRSFRYVLSSSIKTSCLRWSQNTRRNLAGTYPIFKSKWFIFLFVGEPIDFFIIFGCKAIKLHIKPLLKPNLSKCYFYLTSWHETILH